MKKRLLIVLISLLFMLLIFVVSFFGTLNQRRITLAIEIVFLTFLMIYIFGGLAKLSSSIIYGIFLAFLLVLFPKYDVTLIFIGTFLFALNPLADLENKVRERFGDDRIVINKIAGSYAPYYEYRKEVKNYYHLPQTRKFYNEPNYMKLRQAFVILLAMIAVFLLIREVNNLINLFRNFQLHAFFASSYSVIVLVVLTVILYRKGFQSTLNFLTASIFPPAIYTLYLIVKPPYLGIIFGSIVLIVGIYVTIYQYINYRSRIVYEYYQYYDNEKQAEVYANALFEPYVYNGNFNLVGRFVIKANISTFDKLFHNIIVYADFRRFFITAYTYNRNEIVLYTDFHYNDQKNIAKFATYLESIFEDHVVYEVKKDENKEFYEKEFFHTTDYIVARTIYLADILKRLEIQSNVIVSIMAYFTNMDSIVSMSKSHNVSRVPDLDMDGILTVRIDTKIANVDFIIENKVRDLLLDLLINKGAYIRVSVYY